MAFHIEGIVSRGEHDHQGEGGVRKEFDSLQEAMGAIGGWIDRCEFLNVVCFYIYDSDYGLVWTVVPQFPDIR